MKTTLLLAMVLAAGGCGKSASAPASAAAEPAPVAWIKATPNPVPAGDSEQGVTTIAWNTGSPAVNAQVYLLAHHSGGPQPEKLFSGGHTGSQEAAWIRKGVRYEFILYEGTEHVKVLARVTVTRD